MRRKKLTPEEIQRITDERDALNLYLYDREREIPADAQAEHSAPDSTTGPAETLLGRLYRATGGAGGYVVMTSTSGDGFNVWIGNLEQMTHEAQQHATSYNTGLRIVLERLTTARNRLCQETQTARHVDLIFGNK